jgi:hypothetical protein
MLPHKVEQMLANAGNFITAGWVSLEEPAELTIWPK